MQQQTVILGIRGYKLANKDIFSKSDPYIVISKQVNSGGYTPIRTSETIKVKFIVKCSGHKNWEANMVPLMGMLTYD